MPIIDYQSLCYLPMSIFRGKNLVTFYVLKIKIVRYFFASFLCAHINQIVFQASNSHLMGIHYLDGREKCDNCDACNTHSRLKMEKLRNQ